MIRDCKFTITWRSVMGIILILLLLLLFIPRDFSSPINFRLSWDCRGGAGGAAGLTHHRREECRSYVLAVVSCNIEADASGARVQPSYGIKRLWPTNSPETNAPTATRSRVELWIELNHLNNDNNLNRSNPYFLSSSIFVIIINEIDIIRILKFKTEIF